MKSKSSLAHGGEVPHRGCNRVERQHQQTFDQPAEPARIADSARKLSMILAWENPSTRKVPISLARRAIVAYMVFIAAKLLPIAIMKATSSPSCSIGVPDAVWRA